MIFLTKVKGHHHFGENHLIEHMLNFIIFLLLNFLDLFLVSVRTNLPLTENFHPLTRPSLSANTESGIRWGSVSWTVSRPQDRLRLFVANVVVLCLKCHRSCWCFSTTFRVSSPGLFFLGVLDVYLKLV